MSRLNGKQAFWKGYKIFHSVKDFCNECDNFYSNFKDRNIKYIRISCGFDIETTRICKKAYMYHWQFSFNKNIILGRKWEEFSYLLDFLQYLGKKNAGKIIIWVANLGHEFEFMLKRYEFGKVFARKPRDPITARLGKYVEFRDCLKVSGKGGLEELAKNFCKTKKLKGDLDYTVLRNSKTVLTEKETEYCICDVAILSEFADYIFEEFVDKNRKIPLTRTGILREMVKSEIGDKMEEVNKIISSFFPNTAKQYNIIMKYLFRGGFTHGNVYYLGEIEENVFSVDFTSSYPAVMLHFLYPCSPFVKCELNVKNNSLDEEMLEKYCFYMECVFENIQAVTYHSIESKHKIIQFEDAIFDNGRLVKAKRIRVLLTEIDYSIYKMFYKWDSIKILCAFQAIKAKLPKYLLDTLMSVYKTKCELKKAGKTECIEYVNAKGDVNSFYGMTTTRLSFEDWAVENGEWISKVTYEKYDSLKRRQFLSPFWGIYVTAYARFMLLKCVKELDYDRSEKNVIYCDTDSIYLLDNSRNREIITKYNKWIAEMNTDLPEIFQGLGEFEFQGEYELFKTLGAKRYAKYSKKNGFEVTVAGMRKGTFEKKYADKTLLEKFDFFENGFEENIEESLKNTSCYNDYEHSDMVKGELMHEFSSVAIFPIPFKMTIDKIYIELHREIMENERRKLQ